MAEEILTHYVGLGVSGRHSQGDSFPLQGREGYVDNVEAELQPAHLVSGVGVEVVRHICCADELSELPLIIKR
jgi:hypothetical protein